MRSESDHPPRSNQESWEQLIKYFDEYPPSNHWRKWISVRRPAIERCIAAGFGAHFRAGTSMHDIMFSTLDHHRLTNEWRVTIRGEQGESVRIDYCTAIHLFREPEVSAFVPEEDLFAGLVTFLVRLWKDTKPGLPIPDAIAKAAEPGATDNPEGAQ